MTVPTVLSIAGSDPSGGAGIQGDLKTFAAHRVFGCAVVTALTAQSTRGVDAVLGVDAAFVERQLNVLLADVAIDAIKIGMLGSAPVVRAVATVLRHYPSIPVVLDPVLRASTGGILLDDAGLAALVDELLPLVTVVTPNAMEAGALLAVAAPASLDAACHAARAIVRLGVGAAVVTGGHVHDGGVCRDVLASRDSLYVFSAPRVPGRGAHGTGCAYASSVASLLALGYLIPAACELAQRFVGDAVSASTTLCIGHGTPPVHTLAQFWH